MSATSLNGVDDRTRKLVFGVTGCALAFGLILLLAYGFPAARELDAKALQGLLGAERPKLHKLTSAIASLGDPLVVGLAGVVMAGVALLRDRARSAVAVVALLAATSVSGQVLKAVLAYPRFGGQVEGADVAPAAFPSGHSTAAMALAVGCVIVAPARVRPLAGLVGMGVALGVGFSVISLGWHFPSDVAGGFLLAAGWGLAIAAAARLAALRWPEHTVRVRVTGRVRRATDAAMAMGLAALAALGVLLLLVAGAAAVVAGIDPVDVARGRTAAILVCSALAVLALALLAGFVIVLRQRELE